MPFEIKKYLKWLFIPAFYLCITTENAAVLPESVFNNNSVLKAADEKKKISVLYSQGMQSLSAGDTLSAENYFKQSAEKYSDASSYFELAKIYLHRNTFSSRNKAYDYFRIAVWKNPENLDYRYAYASLMKDFARTSSFGEYHEIISRDSSQINAWINLGDLKGEDFDEYNKSVRNMDGFLGSLQEFADEDFREAEFYYKKALEKDPLNYDASLKLSLLYENAGRFCDGINLLDNIVNAGKADKDIYLCRGLLNYKISAMKESFSDYQKALSLMTEKEKRDFTFSTIKFILEPVYQDLFEEFSDEELREFVRVYWKIFDPLYMTDYNERLLEHYSRVAYANLHFSVPKMNVTGWKSNRGETVLRYGEPVDRIRLRPQMGENGVEMKTEVWDYGRFTVGFTDMALSDNFLFSVPAAEKDKMRSQYPNDTQYLMEYLRKAAPTLYEPKFEGPTFETPFNIVQFRNPDNGNMTDVYINYTIEASDSLLNKNNSVSHETGVFLMNKNYEELYRKRRRYDDLIENKTLDAARRKNLISNTIDFTTRPDSGYISFEIMRDKDKGVSANRSDFSVRYFGDYSLAISDLLFAGRVSGEKVTPQDLHRKDFYITPNTLNEFSAGDTLYLYYELYNLKTDEGNLTNFEQQISVQKTDADTSFSIGRAFNSFLNLFGLSSRPDRVTLSSDYKTLDKNPAMYVQLDLTNYEPGKYIISVKVKDLIAGMEANSRSVVEWKGTGRLGAGGDLETRRRGESRNE